MMPGRGWIAIPLALLLAASLPAQAQSGYDVAIESVGLGKLNPGDQVDFQIPVENNGPRAIVVQLDVVPRLVHSDDAAAWFGHPDEVLLKEQRRTDIPLTLTVPEAAHSGQYTLSVNIRTPTEVEGVAGAVKGTDVQVTFTVRGVDIWGRLDIPGILVPEQQLPPLDVTATNLRKQVIFASAVVEVHHDGRQVRTWRAEHQQLYPGQTQTYTIPFSIDGLTNGSYQLKGYIDYTGPEGNFQSAPVLQNLWIGSYELDIVGFRFHVGKQSYEVPLQGTQVLPVGSVVRVSAYVKSNLNGVHTTFQAATLDERVRFESRPLIFPGTHEVELGRFNTPRNEGETTLQITQQEQGAKYSLAQVDIQWARPQIEVRELRLHEDWVRAGLEGGVVHTEAWIHMQITVPNGTTIWTQTGVVPIGPGQAIQLNAPMDPPLEPGEYRLQIRLNSPGELTGTQEVLLHVGPRDNTILGTIAGTAWSLTPYIITVLLVAAATTILITTLRRRRKDTAGAPQAEDPSQEGPRFKLQ